MQNRPIDYFIKYIPGLKKSHGDEYKGLCPFHKEKTPSFFVNSTTGQYICFGCGVTGNVYTFLKETGHADEQLSVDRDYVDEPAKQPELVRPLNPIIVEQFHKNLLSNKTVLEYVTRDRLVSFFTIKKFLLGFDPMSNRIAFPIRSRSGKILNIKLHSSFQEIKSIYYSSSNGGRKLFPIQAVLKQDVVLCEGEFDCMALHSLGINAITSTSGVASFQDEWKYFFTRKNVKIVFDNDAPGVFYSTYTAEILKEVARTVEVIQIPAQEGLAKVDVTDYLRQRKDIFKLLKIQRRQ